MLQALASHLPLHHACRSKPAQRYRASRCRRRCLLCSSLGGGVPSCCPSSVPQRRKKTTGVQRRDQQPANRFKKKSQAWTHGVRVGVKPGRCPKSMQPKSTPVTPIPLHQIQLWEGKTNLWISAEFTMKPSPMDPRDLPLKTKSWPNRGSCAPRCPSSQAGHTSPPCPGHKGRACQTTGSQIGTRVIYNTMPTIQSHATSQHQA